MDIVNRSDLMAANAAFKLPAIPHITDRIHEMREIAQTSKVERAIIVSRNTGDVLWRSPEGQAMCVDVTDAYKAGLTQGNLIIHTHPIPAELSLPDAICAASAGAYGNMAVSPDGTVSWCSSAATVPGTSPALFYTIADDARDDHHVPSFDENDPDFNHICACDNYWIGYNVRKYLGPRGFTWQTYYGDVCMSQLTKEQS